MTAGQLKTLGIALILFGVALLVYWAPSYYRYYDAALWLALGAVALVGGGFAYYEAIRRDKSN